jgi:DsbC/DsbD-like thiol-disulfide interchange protein
MIRLMPLLASLLATTWASLAAAQDLAVSDMPEIDDIVQIDMLPGWQNHGGDQIAALRVVLAPGWKTYWRVAGETGIPPQFNWSGSVNVASVQYLWPRPDVFTADGVQVIGFKNELILPIQITPHDPTQAISASAALNIGICKDVCVPISADINLDAVTGSAGEQFLIELALADRPQAFGVDAESSVACDLTPIEDGYQIKAAFSSPNVGKGTGLVVFETALDNIWVAPTTSQRQGDVILAETSLISFDGAAFNLAPDDLRVTIIWPDHALDILGCPPS